MTTLFKKFGALLLLMACMMNAFAGHGNSGNGGLLWGGMSEPVWSVSQGHREEARQQRAERRGREGRQIVENDSRADSRASSAGASGDEPRRGRLSAEERRALRRQIDEAGRDIYSPHR